MLHARLVHSAADIEYSGASYMVRDPDLFSSTSAQGALTLRRSSGPYTLRAEATYAHAPLRDKTRVGNFVYRITSRFGASNGNYTLWWNNRSDFNHDGELALFGSRKGASTLVGPAEGPALNAAAGMADSDIAGVDDLREHAFSLFASHSWRAGPFKDASASMRHVTSTAHAPPVGASIPTCSRMRTTSRSSSSFLSTCCSHWRQFSHGDRWVRAIGENKSRQRKCANATGAAM